MALHGSTGGLLDGRHASECNGTEYSACRPVKDSDGNPIVVLMEWCGGCAAADWEVV